MPILQMRKQAQEDPSAPTELVGVGLDWGLSSGGVSTTLSL